MKRRGICLFLALCCLFPLLGNAVETQYLISETPVYIKNELFTLFIPAHTPYHPAIEEKIRQFCAWVPTEPGLSLFPPGREEPIVFTHNGGSPSGDSFGVNLEDMDYLFDMPESDFVYLHELSHTMQARMVTIRCIPFVEGFAVCNTLKVARQQDLAYIVWHHQSFNYSFFNPEDEKAMLATDMERFFCMDYANLEEEGIDPWMCYLYGFRFCSYLEAVYGEGFLAKLIVDYASAPKDGGEAQAFVDFLRAETSADVFEAFPDWYVQHADLFASKPPPAL